MKQRLAMLVMLLTLLILITGCWNRRELNDLAIAVAMGIDKSGDEYLVSYQVVDPGEIAAKTGGAGRSPVTLYQEKSDTVFEAVRKITTQSPRKIYSAHLRMLVIGEELAKDGLGNVLDFLSRDHELRTDFYIVVAKGTKAESVLKILTSLEDIPANQMFSSLETSEKAWSTTMKITLDELITNLVSESNHPTITGIRIKGSQEYGETKKNVEEIDSPGRLQYAQIASFKKDKLIGWLNEDESQGFNYTQGQVISTIEDVTCPKGGKLGVELIRTQEKIKGKVEKGKPNIEVELQAEGNVADVACHIDLTKTKSIYELEKRVEQDIKRKIEAALNKAQKKLKTDIFGFGEAIRRADPKAWKEMKKDWDQEFVDLSVNVKVDVKIRRVGTVGNSFLEEIKE